MSRTQTLRSIALSMSVGVLLVSFVGELVPIYGMAAAYIVGDAAWRGLRRIFPKPDDPLQRGAL